MSHGSREVWAGIIGFSAVVPVCYASLQLLLLVMPGQGSLLTIMFVSSGMATMAISYVTGRTLLFAPNLGMTAILVFGMYTGSGVGLSQSLWVFASAGMVVLVLALSRFGEVLVNSVPRPLYTGILSSIGILLIATGMRQAGVIMEHPVTLTALGNLATRSPVVSIVSLLIVVVAVVRGVSIPLIWGLTAALITGWALGTMPYPGTLFSDTGLPRRLLDWNNLAWTFEGTGHLASVVLVTVVETAAVFLAAISFVNQQFGEWRVAARRVWLVTGLAGILTPIFGTPGPVLSQNGFIANISGSRTRTAGLISGGLLLFSALIPVPAFMMGSGYAIGNGVWLHPETAALLIGGGFLCVGALRNLDWDDPEITIPTSLMCVVSGLSFSLVNGVGIGAVAYATIRIVKGDMKSVWPLLLFAGPLVFLRLL